MLVLKIGRGVHALGSGERGVLRGAAWVAGSSEQQDVGGSFFPGTPTAVGSSVETTAQALHGTALAWSLAPATHQHHLLYQLHLLPPSPEG